MKLFPRLVSVGAVIAATVGCGAADWLQRNTLNADSLVLTDPGLKSCYEDALAEVKADSLPQWPFAYYVVGQVKNLLCEGYGVEDTSELFKIAGAEVVDLSNNNLSNLDVGYMPQMKSLKASFSSVETVDVASAPNLQDLTLQVNPLLADINLSNNNALKSLDLTSTGISNIDLDGMTNLWFLNLNDTLVAQLDLTTNVSLLVVEILGPILEADTLASLLALDSSKPLCLVMNGHSSSSDPDCAGI